MHAALVTGKDQVSLVEMPDPVQTAGKAVVDIDYCGICGTDVHAFLSGEPYNPAICGHEWSGRVSAIESGRALREGDRVAIGINAACGQCATCRRGDAAHCEFVFTSAIGMSSLAAPHGGFAPRIAFDLDRLYAVDAALTDEDAAMLEPVTVAVHAVRRTDIRLGDSIVVLGGGPIGLLVLQAARASGAGHITLVEPEPTRRDLGGELGADLLVDPRADDAGARINDALGQIGADVVFECAGIPDTIDQSARLVRRGGVVSLVGVPNRAAEIDGAFWLMQEIRLTSSLAYVHEEFDIAQGLVRDGRIRCAPLHTDTASLADIQGAFERLARAPSEVKILVNPKG